MHEEHNKGLKQALLSCCLAQFLPMIRNGRKAISTRQKKSTE
jgi:hypothetical protein